RSGEAIVTLDDAGRRPPADRQGAAGAPRAAAAGAGIAGLLAVGRLGDRAQLLARTRARVGVERRERGLVERPALGLPVGPVGTADVGALVPVEAEPAEIGEEAGLELRPRAAAIDVLDAHHEGAAGRPGVEPGEERRAGVAEVE